MWLYGSELDRSLAPTECCHHEYVLCRGHCEVRLESDIVSMIDSLESDIISCPHIFISIREKCFQMLIEWALADIAPSGIRDLKRTESGKECREEKYTHTDFLHLLSIDMRDRHPSRIVGHRISIP